MRNTPPPLLSVIIPMYNCASVIKRCLDSIDYSECEILVINDGSTDDGAQVVNLYAISHPNIRIIEKINGGVSSARNLGIENARGEYISFIDADDYICQNGLKHIVDLAKENDADVVKFRAYYVEEKDCQYQHKNVDTGNVLFRRTTGKEALMSYDIPDHVVWDGIYRRKLITQHQIRFNTNLRLHEDDVFNGMIYCHAHNVLVTDMRLYCYVISSSCSWTHGQSVDRQLQLINSGYQAAEIRCHYINAYYPEALSLERLKAMRYVCHPKNAYMAQMTYNEYRQVLNKYRALKVYPLSYRWINIAFWFAPAKDKVKWVIKTYLCNHPKLSYSLLRFNII